MDGKGSSCLGLEKIGQRGMVVFSSILRILNIVEFQNHGPSPLEGSRTSQGTSEVALRRDVVGVGGVTVGPLRT